MARALNGGRSGRPDPKRPRPVNPGEPHPRYSTTKGDTWWPQRPRPGRQVAAPGTLFKIPAATAGTVNACRRQVVGFDDDQDGAVWCLGEELEAGGSYKLPVGTVIVLCDPLAGQDSSRVRVWRVGPDGHPKQERDSTLKTPSAFGASVRSTIRRLLKNAPA